MHSHEDADDVLQETFIKVWRHLGSFRGESQLYTWLYRIATNEALTYLKVKKRKASVPLDWAAAQADVYFDAEHAEAQHLLAMQRLPEKQRLVYQLRYYEEMSYEDMSEITQTSVGALKASYHHASQKVKQYLMGKTHGDY